MEEISNLDENKRDSIALLISKMNELLDSDNKEISMEVFGSTKEVGILKKNNAELKEIVSNCEKDNNRLEDQVKKLQAKLEESAKENDDLYRKYEKSKKDKDYEKVKEE